MSAPVNIRVGNQTAPVKVPFDQVQLADVGSVIPEFVVSGLAMINPGSQVVMKERSRYYAILLGAAVFK